jgi:hypothetical protein
MQVCYRKETNLAESIFAIQAKSINSIMNQEYKLLQHILQNSSKRGLAITQVYMRLIALVRI